MKSEHPIPHHFSLFLLRQWHRLRQQLDTPWTKALFLLALYLLLSQRDLNFSISIDGGSIFRLSESSFFFEVADGESAKNVSQLTSKSVVSSKERSWTAKEQRQLDYVADYASLAQAEMRKHKIPASITLAQALLESNIGSSSLAKKNNNHFGIKCFSRSCKKGHCSNFTDDSHKDFFRIFDSVGASFDAHSQLLKKDRYADLFRLSITDYKSWAKGLSKAGYATDPHYAQKLISLIENLGLAEYDSLQFASDLGGVF